MGDGGAPPLGSHAERFLGILEHPVERNGMRFLLGLKPTATGKSERRMLIGPAHQVGKVSECGPDASD